MKRKPAVAGLFYPSRRDELIEQIRMCFLDKRIGPGKLPGPVETKLQNPIGLVSPHAGYIYSGPVAAWGFLEAVKFGEPSVVVIIGPNHTGLGRPVGVWPEGEWETPLGTVPVNERAVEIVLSNSRYAEEDFMSHIREHSIEVQIPFLQFVFGEVSIVPICLMDQSPAVAEDLASALAKLVAEFPGVLIIASTDLNHYEDQRTTLRKDSYIIEAIEGMDPSLLYEYLVREDISMCGYGGVATLLNMDFENVRILKHATSGDVSGDTLEVVGYLSAILF
ncbi:hypothetical protein THMA_0083 [Thermotoga maritima MSB8]|jgi:hypothetical protein|uniref:MEMO1 family protein TM_0087 n=1 Tax=Thermotoga maritima (strain ATCC 43589 / DSM 3109 / JCM 10099 / NBRC 100826 / MSB8) TaxID=243274 RepID=Y087_THEMA|nr:AmmeMemoRadiSam system protein B [Thermotoga maritima]Q9WXU2.1 RecName: Full=MEMO1 family protein TM_0087 [Thermotoga maritima MSB8]AAD35181.1 conserved hypothetical protein [Thermotoga maritima MSB8]AGL49010.1 putative gene for the hypothesized phosphomevalonate decarboxylase; Predicted dioxygenase [Thermotoga maritima MSB8]AHD18144.1 hypothetical protein THEMA_04370 [Thermotoga maritima MSB8]AKE26033.1 hypothetical protein THMC_0083 [Thermotoga maritima]AKE27895.1 hypothetical protein TH